MDDHHLPAPFASETVERVAAERSIDAAALAAAVRDVQAAAERYVGVDGLVYEWRTAFRADPLVARSETAYVLRVEPRVWAEFADHGGLTDEATGAVKAVHAATAADCGDADEADEAGDDEPLVLARTG